MAKEAHIYIVLTPDEYASLMIGDEINKTICLSTNSAASDDIELRIVLDRRVSDGEIIDAFTEHSMYLRPELEKKRKELKKEIKKRRK